MNRFKNECNFQRHHQSVGRHICLNCQLSENLVNTYQLSMMTLSNGNIYWPFVGESTGHRSQRPVTRSFDVFFDPRMNKRLSKQSRRRWFETPTRSLWRHWNGEPDSVLLSKNMTSTTYFGAASTRLTRCLETGGRLNKKDGLTRYGDSHVKVKTS